MFWRNAALDTYRVSKMSVPAVFECPGPEEQQTTQVPRLYST